jgi:chorismate synthase
VIRLLTAGESHGPSLAFTIEGLPAGLHVSIDDVNAELLRRQRGYGRGGRMGIESDRVEFIAGVRLGVTIGSPICGMIRNKDHENWKSVMSPTPIELADAGSASNSREVYTPRPGHADLAGITKYAFSDARNVLERASARETAARVAAGALCKQLLAEFGIRVYSHVVSIGQVTASVAPHEAVRRYSEVEASPVRCADRELSDRMVSEIDSARDDGDSLGGVFEVIVTGAPVGLGSHVHYDRRLDARIAAGIMSVPGVKGVEIGIGFGAASLRGSVVHDELEPCSEDPRGYKRLSNNAGGIEGGITNGEPIIVRGAMKPIPTLMRPLRTIDLRDLSEAEASTERSDVCAVPAASIVAEAMVALEMAQALTEKCGGDTIEEMKAHMSLCQRRTCPVSEESSE